jgi:hypothetical protein
MRRRLTSPFSVAVNGKVRRQIAPWALVDLRRAAVYGCLHPVARLSDALGPLPW